MNLYFTFVPKEVAVTTLATKSAVNDSTSDLGSGYMAGLGAAVIGLGAYAFYKRKNTQVKNFAFQLP